MWQVQTYFINRRYISHWICGAQIGIFAPCDLFIAASLFTHLNYYSTMGLFSFIKNAGAKVFGPKKPEAPQLTEEQAKIQALHNTVRELGIPVNGLQIDLAEQVIVEGETGNNADREKIILALGNVEGVGAVADNIKVLNPEPESVFHEVKKGDSLSKIAKDVYGDPMKYPLIFEANKPMLSHPDKIYPGQILRIPPL